MSKYTGIQIIFDIFGCDCEQIENQAYLIKVMETLTELLGTNILTENCHKFLPQGISLVLIISASHITVHTWPENQYISIDIFTCAGTDIDFIAIEKFLKNNLICNSIKCQKIYRGINN